MLLRQNCRDDAIQHRDVAEYKRWLIRKAGGVVEEDMVADWLGMSLLELRRYTEGGELIAVDMDGRTVYPAFQLKNPKTVLDVREILSVMPIKAPWMRLEWFLTPDGVLDGDTPWEALRAGRREVVLDCARSHGA